MYSAPDSRLGCSSICDDQSVCRDYLRNVCKRGKKCKFKHPSLEECERLRLSSSLDYERSYFAPVPVGIRFDKTFCHDFQNSTCRRPNCKFLHYTKEEEEMFRRTGYLPNDIQWSYRPASSTFDEKTPICKDFCNGTCNRGSNCKYRHVTTPQETVNPGLYSQPNLQKTGFMNTNVSSTHFDPSLVNISNPSNPPPYGQSSLINRAVIVSPNDPILNPVSNAYIPVASSHSIVGLIGNTSTGQPTLYTHSSLVSITSAPHITPCSSVITVSPDPTQHPNILHPQTALSAPHATYHIVPHDASPHHHHHLLATSSSHSHAPALLTIPLSQFTCSVSNNSLIQSQATITTQHHAVVTGVLPANSSISTAPATYFPSYGVFHINQPSLETRDHQNQQHQQITTEIHKQVRKAKLSSSLTTTPVTATTTSTTSVASSTTAVLAAAAAAGYIAQHLPVIGPTNISESGTISQDLNNNLILNQSKGVNVHESALAAAANLPTVSAAAAAAVAAAAAFARSTSITQNSKIHEEFWTEGLVVSASVTVPVKKPKVPGSHPPVINMITAAILAVKDRKGSSLATIKKYIAANYKFDVEKQTAHIRRAIVHGVEKGAFTRVGNKGKGASGSFNVAEKKNCCPVIPNVQVKSNELGPESNFFSPTANINTSNSNTTSTTTNNNNATLINNESCSCQDSSCLSNMKHDNNINPMMTTNINTVTTTCTQSHSTRESTYTSDNNNNNNNPSNNNSKKPTLSSESSSITYPGSSSSDYLNPTDEEQAKTAAAVAAAACIGTLIFCYDKYIFPTLLLLPLLCSFTVG
ncbi:unnamed protein product [Schistosoma mattheei]|uniref:Uncharacterized protein n=1 Tax=Schistosoma mattheei TaxID=31246 RepID=A0A183NVI8_9TREM|nr:unnamed protein product [Schistosoma mattheei]